jgi:Uma2 family endonuclease
MSSTQEYMDAIERLPRGATLILHDVTWDDYEALTDDLMVAGLHARVSYDHGRVEVMSPRNEHERCIRFIDAMVRAYAEHLNMKLEAVGQTTWRRRVLQQGLEPDCCYYVTNANRIIGIRRIDLDVDPPPDIAVEIDITNSSLSKFHIYAALKIPEIWGYDDKTFQFYQLGRASYHATAESRALPGLEPQILADALEQSKTEGQTPALAAFRKALA